MRSRQVLCEPGQPERRVEARPEKCARHVDASVGVVTALVPLLGYERAAEMAKEALATGRAVREPAREALGMTDEELDLVLDSTVLATHARVLPRTR